MWTWIGFLVVASLLMLYLNLEKRYDLIPSFILLAVGLPTFISGFVIKFKPLIFGGVSMWIISLFVYITGEDLAPVAIAVAMVTGDLIPGYLIRRKEGNDAV